jgi:carbon-monoxide dehydrogenase medium subunit
VAALVRRSGDVIEEARVGLTNMGSTPLRASATDAALAGAAATAGAVAEAAELAAEGTSPTSDLSGQADYRQHLARVLTQDAGRVSSRDLAVRWRPHPSGRVQPERSIRR